ncbi:MAG: hypothetical protein KDD03_11850, partial [Gelidibacter sp.]|nr:hypothetical protein [Gelidibacter sp.]
KNSVFKNLISIWIESNDIEALEEYSEQIIVIDPRPISTLKFKLNKKEKDFLVEAGKLSAIRFLDKKKKINKADFDYDNRRIALEAVRDILKKTYRRKRILKKMVFSILLITSISLLFFS